VKNALIFFAIVLPLLVLNQVAFDGKSDLLSAIIFSVPFIGLNLLLRKSHLHHSKSEIFIKVFKTCLTTGVFYAIWIGLYQFILINHIETNLTEELLINNDVIMKVNFPEQAEEISGTISKLIRQPLTWVSIQLVINSFFFSIFGLILGFVFKSKVSQQ